MLGVYSVKLRFNAGYAINKPSGTRILSLMANSVREAIRLPPALSPTKTTRFGIISFII